MRLYLTVRGQYAWRFAILIEAATSPAVISQLDTSVEYISPLQPLDSKALGKCQETNDGIHGLAWALSIHDLYSCCAFALLGVRFLWHLETWCNHTAGAVMVFNAARTLQSYNVAHEPPHELQAQMHFVTYWCPAFFPSTALPSYLLLKGPW